ncbi:MAG: alkyl hydroperoxide reductase subunit F [Marinifilaceae bacterium]
MLDNTFKEQIKGIFVNLKANYIFQILVSLSHPNRQELIDLLTDVVSCSDKLSLDIKEGEGLQFSILKNGETNGIIFRAVPNGHEFTTLLLAILNLDGQGKNLPDDVISDNIKRIKGPVTVKSYISLTCTNCPDVVQALNICAILNPAIRHEIIDGAINQQEVEKLGIQAVPTVYANNELLVVGKSTLTELVTKLQHIAGVDETQKRQQTKKEYDVIIVGGGPAGSSAAIYSARKGFKVAIIAERIGGQILDTVDIENMISVPKTTGKLLAESLTEHMHEYAIDIIDNRTIKNINITDGVKNITTSFDEEFSSPALIVATGASWRLLNVPGEKEYIGRGVAFCTHCDGPFYKDKKVVVVGGGNSGLEAALDLSNIAKEVTIVEFLPELKGDKVLQDKLRNCPNVSIIVNAQSTEVLGNGEKVTGISYMNRKDNSVNTINCDGIFVQIGLVPNSQIIKDIVNVTARGEIQVDATCRTNIPGIYAAGDVTTVPYKQIVIAMGEGAKAALSAFEDSLKDAWK